jgi:hypothetical protein
MKILVGIISLATAFIVIFNVMTKSSDAEIDRRIEKRLEEKKKGNGQERRTENVRTIV